MRGYKDVHGMRRFPLPASSFLPSGGWRVADRVKLH